MSLLVASDMEVVLSVLGVLYVFRYVSLYTLVVISVMQSVSKQATINQKKMSATFITWVNFIFHFKWQLVCSSSYLKMFKLITNR